MNVHHCRHTNNNSAVKWIVWTVSLLTLVRLHAAQTQLVREHDI